MPANDGVGVPRSYENAELIVRFAKERESDFYLIVFALFFVPHTLYLFYLKEEVMCCIRFTGCEIIVVVVVVDVETLGSGPGLYKS